MGIFVRGNKLWARYRNEDGKWVSEATGYSVGSEASAQRCLRRLMDLAAQARVLRESEAARARAPKHGPTAGGDLTVAGYVEKWLHERRALKLASWSDDAARLRLHVVPSIGKLRLDEVSPRHAKELVMGLRNAGKLAPRTIRHVFSVMCILFKDAVADELIRASPCVLRKGVLPKKVDKDPEWRATAIFTRDELQLLLTAREVLQDRRILYALKGVIGLRHSEAARLRWRHYDATTEPLGTLHLGKTKTGVPRAIPVHPTLAKLLDEWRDAGWERVFGRPPTAEDLIVPTRNMTTRQRSEAQEALLLDLTNLGLRPRRGHDLRRTFITLAQADGAARNVLEAMTHGPRGDIVDVYTSFPWPVMCREMAKFQLELPEPKLPPAPTDPTRYTLVTADQRARNRWSKDVTPPGIEPGIAP